MPRHDWIRWIVADSPGVAAAGGIMNLRPGPAFARPGQLERLNAG